VRFWDPAGTRYGIPTYPWRMAPHGLATRRQLAADGLRPGGQPIAAQIMWRGRNRRVRAAYLYLIAMALPKREPPRLSSPRSAGRWPPAACAPSAAPTPATCSPPATAPACPALTWPKPPDPGGTPEMSRRNLIEVEPGVFRPRGALGPLTNADGEVIARSGWPHISSGLDRLTPEQRARLDAVRNETGRSR
jgi:hypothetical protein